MSNKYRDVWTLREKNLYTTYFFFFLVEMWMEQQLGPSCSPRCMYLRANLALGLFENDSILIRVEQWSWHDFEKEGGGAKDHLKVVKVHWICKTVWAIFVQQRTGRGREIDWRTYEALCPPSPSWQCHWGRGPWYLKLSLYVWTSWQYLQSIYFFNQTKVAYAVNTMMCWILGYNSHSVIPAY